MKKQHGFSLIELMVALLISLILSAGLLVTFMSERRTFTDQEALSRLQENQQIIISRFNDIINAAGFYADTTNYTLASALPATTITSVGLFSAGQSVLGISSTSFAIRYQVQSQYTNSNSVVVQTNNAIQDCLGRTGKDYNATTSAKVITNIFRFDSSTQQVVCTVYADNSQSNAVVADKINSISVLYGYDETSNGSATRYYEYSAVSDWNSVKSIMITFNFVNPNDTSKIIPITSVFVMNNKVK